MKKSLADGIEQYIKALIARSEDGEIVIQRSELAETFACAPSQVTYVVSTRFTVADGYSTQSRRGGMGYMRVTRIKAVAEGSMQAEALLKLVDELGRQNRLRERETELLKLIVEQAAERLPYEYQDKICLGIGEGLRRFLEAQADK